MTQQESGYFKKGLLYIFSNENISKDRMTIYASLSLLWHNIKKVAIDVKQSRSYPSSIKYNFTLDKEYINVLPNVTYSLSLYTHSDIPDIFTTNTWCPPHIILFGTEWSWFERNIPFWRTICNNWLSMIYAHGITETDFNLCEWLGLRYLPSHL